MSRGHGFSPAHHGGKSPARPRGAALTTVGLQRPEYAALAEELVRLASWFGHELDATLRHDVARLASAIEVIDRRIDEADDEERSRRWAGVLERLAERAPVVELPDELAGAADDLVALGRARLVLPRLRRLVAAEARISERLRRTRSQPEYVRAIEREGRLTAGLALVVAGPAVDGNFRRFFFRLAAPANLVDKLLDLRGDHARGEVRLAPTLSVHLRLALTLCWRTLALVVVCPRPLSLVGLGWRYLGPARPGA